MSICLYHTHIQMHQFTHTHGLHHNNEMQNFSLSCFVRCSSHDEHTHTHWDFVLKSDRIRIMLAAHTHTHVSHI